MGLYQRITGVGGEKVSVHHLSAALGELAEGNITRQQLIDAFALDATEQTQIDAIGTAYTNKPSAAAKVGYLWQIERAMILAEAGDYNETKLKTVLGF